MEWLEAAQRLQVDDKCRIDCSCGTGRTMVVNNYIKHYSAYCFRCNRKEYHYKGQIGLNECTFKDKEVRQVKIELPEDTIPLIEATGYYASIGRKIMYRCNIMEDLWTKHNIGFSDSLRRVVMPVYDSNNLIWYQLRATEANKIKYLQPSADKNVCYHIKGNKDTIVITEDILSAIKVSQVTDTLSLLGTKINNKALNILSEYKEVVIWLDGDTAGINGSHSIRKSISLLCDNVRQVLTESDPKKYNMEQIREIIGA